MELCRLELWLEINSPCVQYDQSHGSVNGDGWFRWTHPPSKLLHTPSLVVVGLSVRYKTWAIGCGNLMWVAGLNIEQQKPHPTAVDSGSVAMHMESRYRREFTKISKSQWQSQNACREGCARRLWKSLIRNQAKRWRYPYPAPVAIQWQSSAWNLDPSVHWNATGERIIGSQCVSSGLPVSFQWSSSVLQLCKLTLDRHWDTPGC